MLTRKLLTNYKELLQGQLQAETRYFGMTVGQLGMTNSTSRHGFRVWDGVS